MMGGDPEYDERNEFAAAPSTQDSTVADEVDINKVSQFLNQRSSEIMLSSMTSKTKTMMMKDKRQRRSKRRSFFDDDGEDDDDDDDNQTPPVESEYRSVQRLIDSSSPPPSPSEPFPDDEAVEIVLVDDKVVERRDDEFLVMDREKEEDDKEDMENNEERIGDDQDRDGAEETTQLEDEKVVLSVDTTAIDSSSGDYATVEDSKESKTLREKYLLGLLSPRTAFRLDLSSQFKITFKETSKTSIAVAIIAILLVVPLPHLLTIMGAITLFHDVAFHIIGRRNKLWSHLVYQKLQMYHKSISEARSVDEFRREHVCWWPDEARDVEDQLERARKMYQFFVEEEQAKQKIAVAKASEILERQIHKLERDVSEANAQRHDEKQQYLEEIKNVRIEHDHDHQKWKDEMKAVQTQLAEALEQIEMQPQQSNASDDAEADAGIKTRSSFEARLESAESHSRAMQALLSVQEWELKNKREMSKEQRKELEEKVLSSHVQYAKMARYVAELIKVIELSGMAQSKNNAVNYDIVREAAKYLLSVESKTQLDIVALTENDAAGQSEKKTQADLPSQDGEGEAAPSSTTAVAKKGPKVDTINGNLLMDFALLLSTSVDAVYFWTVPIVSSVLPSSWPFNFTRGTRK
mmetsp:Transcript_9049/g.22895  ORF Transcript_9049/g.22895 Transcript_9049/m.22895 type:complete len:635 (+) Transcript_9049:352-2256(+)